MKKILSFSFIALFSLLSISSFAQSEELGLASYYGDKFHGRKTAYGDTYDRDKMTCAHKRHKYGTQLKVTRIDNKKSVIVTVTDKGPFIKGRVVDLSFAAAKKIGLVQDGVAEVKVEVVGKEGVKSSSTTTAAKKENNTTTERPTEFSTQPIKPEVVEVVTKPVKKASSDSRTTVKKPTVAQATNNTLTEKGVFKINSPDAEQKYAVQVASLNNYDNAARRVAELKAKWFKNVLLMAEPSEETVSYKVLLGPYGSAESAKSYQKSLAKKHKLNGFVVSLPAASQTTAKGGEPTESSANNNVMLDAPGAGDYGVQVASLDSFDAALRQVDALKAKWFKNLLVKIEGESYKVILGPMADEKAAKNYSNSLAKRHKIKGFVVQLSE
jgi:rare lipoprotein A